MRKTITLLLFLIWIFPVQATEVSMEDVTNSLEQGPGKDIKNGKQIKEISQAHKTDFANIEADLEIIKSRNKFSRFLIGPNYKKITRVNERINMAGVRSLELEEIAKELEQEKDKEIIKVYITEVEEVRKQYIQDIEDSSSGFSLFGWFIKLFQ